MDDRPERAAPVPTTPEAPHRLPSYLTKRPGEAPSAGLRRSKAEAPAEFRRHIKYLPHSGAKQREKGLRRLAQQRGGMAIEACRVCGTRYLLDDLGDLPDGRLACASCLNADMQQPKEESDAR